jgi:hypothetical protein
MYRSRPRLRVRNLKKRCCLCKGTASRFQDVAGQERKWYCAGHFKTQEETTNGNS